MPGLRRTGRGRDPGRAAREDVALADDDQVVRTLLRVLVQPLAVVAADALGEDDVGPAHGAPLARFLADPAVLALAPALDAEHGQLRDDAEERADRAQEPAIQIADEDRGEQQEPQRDPQHRRAMESEKPEG